MGVTGRGWEITDEQAAEVLWASDGPGKAACDAVYRRAGQLNLNLDRVYSGALAWAAWQAIRANQPDEPDEPDGGIR